MIAPPSDRPGRELPRSWFAVYPEGHARAGQEMTREAECECGTVFTQRILSEAVLRVAVVLEQIETLPDQLPGLFVPQHCARCERILLHRAPPKPPEPPRPTVERPDTDWIYR